MGDENTEVQGPVRNHEGAETEPVLLRWVCLRSCGNKAAIHFSFGLEYEERGHCLQ
jgi:hypothetical protein